jgi:hypothetical protein
VAAAVAQTVALMAQMAARAVELEEVLRVQTLEELGQQIKARSEEVLLMAQMAAQAVVVVLVLLVQMVAVQAVGQVAQVYQAQ